MNQLKIAKTLAFKYHEGQMYDDGPYTFHLEYAAKVLTSLMNIKDKDLEAACWLHDILEDTPATSETLRAAGVNERVIKTVEDVTDEPGENRKEKKRKTYPKIKANKDAVIVKICDRMSHVENCVITNNKKYLDMYRREHKEFRKQLEDPKDKKMSPIWDYFDHLFGFKKGH